MQSRQESEDVYMNENDDVVFRCRPVPETQTSNSIRVHTSTLASNDEADISKKKDNFKVIISVMVAFFFVVMLALFGVQANWVFGNSNQNIELKKEIESAMMTSEKNHLDFIQDLKNESRNATRTLQRNLMAAVNVLRDHLENEIANCKRDWLEYSNKANAYDERFNSTYFTNCRRVFAEDAKKISGSGGVFDIYIRRNETEVFCDLETDAGGWTVFQRRMDGSENFYRGWDDYVHGFGNLIREFWMGLETLHRMTATSPHEMRVDLEAWDNEKRYAKYSTFHVGNLESKYAISISGHSGTAADSISRENGSPFTTKDTADHKCATAYKGAWWYGDCHEANLNGIYYKTGPTSPFGIGVNWRHWKGYYYSMKRVEMKIRPLNL